MTSHDEGYGIFRTVFSPPEMTAAIDALQTADVNRTRAGARHILHVPTVHALACDPRLINIARQFVGPAAIAFRVTLFDKSPESNWLVVWHQDTALPLCRRVDDSAWGPWSTKAGVLYAHAPAWALEKVVALRVHLDPSAASNGPLRVLPNTHGLGILSEADIEQLARERTAVDCLAAAGEVVAMRPLTIHASSKSRDAAPRRVLHIEYAAALRLAPGIELASA